MVHIYLGVAVRNYHRFFPTEDADTRPRL